MREMRCFGIAFLGALQTFRRGGSNKAGKNWTGRFRISGRDPPNHLRNAQAIIIGGDNCGEESKGPVQCLEVASFAVALAINDEQVLPNDDC